MFVRASRNQFIEAVESCVAAPFERLTSAAADASNGGLEYGMTKTTMPENRVSKDSARTEIELRVASFRQHQAKMQADREQRWARVMAEARASLHRNDP